MEKETYAGNTITLDAKLLQDIFFGSWTRRQLYGLTPDWHRDSFYNIVQPLERRLEDYEISIRPRPPLTQGYCPRLLPIGPPSDISSIDRPPSTVGPSVSVYELATPKRKVNFSISHYTEGLERGSPNKDVQTENIPITQVQDSPQLDGGGQT